MAPRGVGGGDAGARGVRRRRKESAAAAATTAAAAAAAATTTATTTTTTTTTAAAVGAQRRRFAGAGGGQTAAAAAQTPRKGHRRKDAGRDRTLAGPPFLPSLVYRVFFFNFLFTTFFSDSLSLSYPSSPMDTELGPVLKKCFSMFVRFSKFWNSVYLGFTKCFFSGCSLVLVS